MLSVHDLKPYVTTAPNGQSSAAFLVDGIHCAACMGRVERALSAIPGITSARVNLTTKRVVVSWQGPLSVMVKAASASAKAGYSLTPYTPQTLDATTTTHERWLLRCLAVAGFASMNVMLLSVALWSGPMPTAQRLLLQWFSAIITLPAIAYAGQPYFRAAWQALSHGRTSMEVPISIALILTTSLSLFDTILGHGETYFESAVMLLFFLLAGRYLEARVRGQSHNAAAHLMGLQHTTVAVLGKGGKVHTLAANAVPVGATVLWRHGERLGVDGTISHGHGTVDASVLTGESLPRAATVGDAVQAGLVNTGPTLHVRATAVGQSTVLAELARLTEAATHVKNRYTRLADKIARIYAPVVHTLALFTLAGWLLVGLNWHESLLRAAAVLIVTCPCALALAVPTVQVAVVGNLLKRGIILKNGEALEKLAHTRTIVLDKTGTLTTGRLHLVRGGTPAQRTLAARLAVISRHPLAQGITASLPAAKPLPHAREVVGQGVQGTYQSQPVRLGSAAFCGLTTTPTLAVGEAALYLKTGTAKPVLLVLKDTLRPEAAATISTLTSMGMALHLLSGDTPAAAAAMAAHVGIPHATGHATPAAKQSMLARLATTSPNLMMVGDGLNDAPSIALAPVGVSFGKATDLAKLSADIILHNESLTALPLLLRMACTARTGVRGNVGVSLAYNVVAVPLAMAGFITPIWAAVLMSTSSILVVANAARLGKG
ncbi:MAG: heavy metal translocating P-type ATPase [Alphaproteobacteria bacterium]